MMQKGFSLIEIMVAVTIIGLLTAGILISFAGTRLKSRETRRITDVSQIADAVDNYNSLHDSYPSQTTIYDLTIDQSLDVLVIEGLMKILPTDPKPASPGGTGISRCFNYTYQSPVKGSQAEYKIAFGAEMAGVSSRHPLNNNIYADTLSGCSGTRGDARILGPTKQ